MIPALNAEASLGRTLTALTREDMAGAGAGAGAVEIIVVDGGSDDATAAVAAKHGARVVRSPRGRGRQLARGAAEASGEWLLFLHADTVPEPGWAAALM